MTTRQRNRHQPNDRVRAKYDPKSGLVRLNVPLTVKAETINKDDRTFEGLAATWDEDLGQDVIHKGAFKDSIVEWKSSGDAMPLLNSHDHFDIFAALGQAVALKETTDGLWSKWEVLDGADGDRVMQRLRPSKTTGKSLIGKMSIGFIPLKFDFEQPEGTESFWDRIRHITKAALKEVSLVLFPMNPNAAIDASTVKMMLKMAHDTDPRRIDPLTRHELRRLNSKIGLLLKKQKPEDDDEIEEDDDDELPPPTRKSSAPKKKERKDDDASSDDADDTDDSVDDEDGDDGDDDATDDKDDSTDDADDTDDDDEDDDEDDDADDKEPKSAKGKKQKKQKKGQYEFSEALAQRLKKVTLKHRTEEAKTRLPAK